MVWDNAPRLKRAYRGLRGTLLTELATPLQGALQDTRTVRRRSALSAAWVVFLLAILTFLVVYPILTLLLGALTDTNPVVEGFSLRHLSLANFITVLINPNVAGALLNTMIACTGGTAIAVAIGLTFSWIVVRTNTPFKRLIAAAIRARVLQRALQRRCQLGQKRSP